MTAQTDLAAIQAAGKKMVGAGQALIGGAKKLAKKLKGKKPAKKVAKKAGKKKGSKKK